MANARRPSLNRAVEALRRRVLSASSDLVDDVGHHGERGILNENKLKEFLREILPKRFQLGSGFVICSDGDIEPSKQTDLVVYDEYWNPAIFSYGDNKFFPVETVYGTIEVKTTLRSRDLDSWKNAVQLLRGIGSRKYFYAHNLKPSERGGGKNVVSTGEKMSTVPPRAYLIAYSADLGDFDAFCKAVRTRFIPEPFFHAIYIIEQKWFVSRRAGAASPEESLQFADELELADAMIAILHGLNTMVLGPMSLPRYMEFIGEDPG